ncbi:MAG TPA: isomerase [Rhodobacteraceae bacterium]|nr:isomerase [Paracoccaceae bacterium]
MKLKDMEVIVVGTPPPGWGGRYFIFVKVTTDNGIVGWGEVYAAAVGPKAMTAVIEDVFSRHMQGENPENVEMMFRRAYSSGFTQRPDPTVIGAFSGLEIACWDILGKAHGRPVHALLGGMMNDRVRSYTYLYPLAHQDINQFWGNADMAAECAAEMVRLGFTAVKFDPAGPYTLRGGHQPAVSDIAQSVEFCRKIRAAVGSKADLLFGTHGQFTTSGAIRLGRQLEEFDPLWFEEPMPPDNIDEFRRVADAIRIPIATGERLLTRWGFREILETGAASILQPDTCHAGGISEIRRIGAMAEVYYAGMAPHNPYGPVSTAACVQVDFAMPNFVIQEMVDPDTSPISMLEFVVEPLQVVDGHILPPTKPGIGVEVDEAACMRRQPDFSIETTRTFVSWYGAKHADGGVADS